MRALALAAILIGTPQAALASGLWGYGGLVLMPDGRVGREIEIGGRALTDGPSAQGYLRGGYQSWELSLAYGLPRHDWPTLSVKHQLLKPTTANPTAIAVGVNLLGAPQRSFLMGNQAYMVLTRDINGILDGRPVTYASVHAGVTAGLDAHARLMGGLEVPIGERATVVLEGFGPQASMGGFANIGASLALLPGLQASAFVLGRPGGSLLERDLAIGLSWSAPLPQPAGPPPAPAEPPPMPAPTPAATVSASPPPLPYSVLTGLVRDAAAKPLGGYRVRLAGQERRTSSKGRFFFGGLRAGSHDLVVLDPQGRQVASRSVDLPAGRPTDLTLVVKPPPVKTSAPAAVPRWGSLGGSVTAGRSPIPGAKITVEGADLMILTLSDAQGHFEAQELVPGDYRIRIEHPRFRAHAGQVKVVAGARARFDATLQEAK